MKEEMHFTVLKQQELLAFLLETFQKTSRKKVKEILGSGSVFVNGVKTTQFNQILHVDDAITIYPFKATKKGNLPFTILEENKDIIVVIKPSGILSVSTEKEKEKTLYYEVSRYVKKENPNNKIFIVHRLDKETSGIILFAKNEKVKRIMQERWEKIVLEREYIAVVEGKIEKKKDTIRSYLTEDKNYMVHSTTSKKDGVLAITEYEVIGYQGTSTILRIHLKTGRKNQIRVHMSEMGHPIIGDKKYGSTKNPYHRLLLHASRLVLIDPITGKKKSWESWAPFLSNYKSVR